MKTMKFWRKIEKDTRRQKECLCSWISRINILKMSVLPEPSSISMQFLEKFQGHFFRNRKTIVNLYRISKDPK
jgi:hypothetical protein